MAKYVLELTGNERDTLLNLLNTGYSYEEFDTEEQTIYNKLLNLQDLEPLDNDL